MSKTLNNCKYLLEQYAALLKALDTDDETVYERQHQELLAQLKHCFALMQQADMYMFQTDIPDYIGLDDVVELKNNLRSSAARRYSLDIIPNCQNTYDVIGTDSFALPCYTLWQDENNSRQNFVIKYSSSTKAVAKETLETLLLNILIGLPVKKVNVNIFDFPLTGMADYFSVGLPPQLYHDTIVVDLQTAHERLHGLLEHMAAVMKKYGDLAVYNNRNQEIAMPYEIVVLAGYPTNYDSYIDELLPLFENGPRCGIYFIVLNDTAGSLRDKEQRHLLQCGNWQEIDVIDHFVNRDGNIRYTPCAEHTQLRQVLMEYITEEAGRVEKRAVLKQDFGNNDEAKPFETVSSEISVTVGLDIESKKEVTLRFNSGDYIHAFILGQSGSGKSVLLNNIITTAINKYSPEDLMLYLLDFKGVEFNRYRGVRHTKAVLVDNSDPQMTLEVLRELKEENKRRVKLWQREGVNNIDGYNTKHPDARLPQVLFVADECQVMFSRVDAGINSHVIQREIAEIINIIATQGRSQGIHMLLATQQLDDTDISGQVLKNLTECFLLMSAPSDSDRLVPDSSELTAKQPTGQCCYYHKKELQAQLQTFYATDEELEAAIAKAQHKAANSKGNGGAYFKGSDVFSLNDDELAAIRQDSAMMPIVAVGRNIGMKQMQIRIMLQRDFSENILFFGANKQEQTVGVVMNAMLSVMESNKALGVDCEYLVIDCLGQYGARYRRLLETMESKGLCHIIERQRSGRTLRLLSEDIRNRCARPVILTIIGNERFAELKRNSPLEEEQNTQTQQMALDGFDIEPLGFSDISDLGGSSSASSGDSATYQQALQYILDEGPMQGVHVLLHVDKPGNILFEGDYGVNATDKFRHKIILRSENKFLSPMRFSVDIDVETLNDDEDNLRAYYYPEGGIPQLFTPFVMPEDTIIR